MHQIPSPGAKLHQEVYLSGPVQGCRKYENVIGNDDIGAAFGVLFEKKSVVKIDNIFDELFMTYL